MLTDRIRLFGTKKKRNGGLIALLLFGIILVFTGFYFYNTRLIPKQARVTDYFPINNPKAQDNSLGDRKNVCVYIDYLHENIYEPNPSTDNIQKNIGYQNNKVGLYIYAEVNDFVKLADELANSNGGEWGYVLIPYNVKDYNEERWGKLFERLSEKKLIPIIQLWDLDLEIENIDKQISKSAQFLNELKWPIKKRYISVYNEPNDKNFWKGEINPEEYAMVLSQTIDAFKALDADFFIMNGALNTSARTGGNFLDAKVFMQRMDNQVPGIFKKLDGWASHPYPQPNFSGSPKGTGRDSIRAYEWELDILKNNFGVKSIPVFITETGWAHKETESEDGNTSGYTLDQYKVADYIRYAFEEVWLKDDRVVAVTPFTIRYEPPHDHFSWVQQDGDKYPQFDAVKDIKKVKGKPPVVNYLPSKKIECKYE